MKSSFTGDFFFFSLSISLLLYNLFSDFDQHFLSQRVIYLYKKVTHPFYSGFRESRSSVHLVTIELLLRKVWDENLHLFTFLFLGFPLAPHLSSSLLFSELVLFRWRVGCGWSRAWRCSSTFFITSRCTGWPGFAWRRRLFTCKIKDRKLDYKTFFRN